MTQELLHLANVVDLTWKGFLEIGEGSSGSALGQGLRLWALFLLCSQGTTAPSSASSACGFSDVGRRQQAINLAQTKEPLDKDGCH